VSLRKKLSLASERVTSLLVQRSNQETPQKEHDFVATEISGKIVEDQMPEGMRRIAIK
jgi:hypothetical protein